MEPGPWQLHSPPGACERGGVGWSELLISGPAAPKCHHLTVWSVMPPLETVFRKTWQQAQTSHSTGAQAKKSVPCTQGKRTVLDSRRGSECSPPPPGVLRRLSLALYAPVFLSSTPSGTLHRNWLRPHSPLPAEGLEQWPGLKGRNGRCGGRSSLGASIPGLYMDELMISLDLPSMPCCPGWLLPLECAKRACLRLPASQHPQGRVNTND